MAVVVLDNVVVVKNPEVETGEVVVGEIMVVVGEIMVVVGEAVAVVTIVVGVEAVVGAAEILMVTVAEAQVRVPIVSHIR